MTAKAPAATLLARLTDEQRDIVQRYVRLSFDEIAALQPYPGPEPLTAAPTRNPETPPRRFDGAAIWSRLSTEQQTAFGAAAIELAIARYGAEVARDEREERLILAAEEACNERIDELAEEHVLVYGVVDPDEVPGIPTLLGPVCRQCGCTEHNACWTPPWGEGCRWVEPDLCSACAANSHVRPRTAPVPESVP